MLSNRIPLAVLALVCIAAAGAGGYFATRHDVAAVAAPTAAAESMAPTPSQPVQETEALVSPPAKRAEQVTTAPQGTASPAAAKRPESTARPSARQQQTAAAAPRPAEPPALDHSWPSGTASSSSAPPNSTAAQIDSQTPSPRVEERPQDTPRTL